MGGLTKTSSKQLQRRFITFLTNQGFWSGGIRNKAGLEAPCGACSAHSAALRTQQCSWKPSATQLGLVTSLLHRMHFSHTEGAGMCPASQGCSLCRLSTLQPLFGLLKGLRQLPVNCVLISAVSCFTKRAEIRQRLGEEGTDLAGSIGSDAALHITAGRLMEDVLVSTWTELFSS